MPYFLVPLFYGFSPNLHRGILFIVFIIISPRILPFLHLLIKRLPPNRKPQNIDSVYLTYPRNSLTWENIVDISNNKTVESLQNNVFFKCN